MARLVPEREAGPLAPLYAEIREEMGLGAVPAVFQAMAAVGNDVLAQNWTAYRYTVLEGLLPRALKEMIGLAVARAARCSYGVALHSRALAMLGVSAEVVRTLAEHGDSAYLPLRDRAVLRFAEGYDGSADDVTLFSLEGSGYSEEEVAEAADTVLLAEGLCRMACEAGLTEDEP